MALRLNNIPDLCYDYKESRDVMKNIQMLINAIKQDQDTRAKVTQLKDAMKEEPIELEADFLLELLKNEDNKIRKNAAIITRYCGLNDHEDIFLELFLKEENWIVKNEMIEVIKSFSLKDHLALLQEFFQTLNTNFDDPNWRHKEEMKGRLMEIFYYYGIVSHPQFIDLSKKEKVILTSLNTNSEIIFDKLKTRNKKMTSMGILLLTDSICNLEKIRDYNELLFVLSGFKEIDFTMDAIAKQIADSNLMSLLNQMHKGDGIYSFRIDTSFIKKDKFKNDEIKRLGLKIQTLTEGKLINDASDYDIELRLRETPKGFCQVFLKLYTYHDPRFEYRKNALATSLQPYVAASIADLISPFVIPKARVIDLCCGSGTLLIERHFIEPCKFLMGIDIYNEAIEMAKENSELAGVNIHFVQRDLNRFTHAHQFDEVMVNLPIQSATKDRKSIETLYMQFIKKAIELTVPNGFIFVHTSEVEIFKKTMRFYKDQIELIDEKKMRIRRGQSALFIIQVK